MPEFLDKFASVVCSKGEGLKNRILKGRQDILKTDFEKYVNVCWVPIRHLKEFSVNPSEVDVLAVDSSVYTNLLSNGGVYYIIRSLAMRRDVAVGRMLESDVIFGRDKMSRIHELIVAKMEMLEFEVALEALNRGFDGDAILFDGSLYGRVSHVPIEYKVEEERDTLLRYFEVYRELLDACRKSDVLIVGVSKESRSMFYRDYLLSLIFDEKLRELDVEEGDKKLLKEIFSKVLDVEKVAFEKFSRLKEKYGSKLDVVELILKELASSRPDYQLIMNYVSSVGYMRPLLLGPSLRMARRLKEYQKNSRKFVRKYFPRSFIERGEEFVHWASEIFRSISEFPSFISFYILPNLMDSPIRVDMPYCGKSLSEVGWPEPIDVDISDLLKVMITGYCGLDSYNLWLKNVDEKVRLRRKIVDDIYFPFLERLFGEKIIRGRSYRRVKYP